MKNYHDGKKVFFKGQEVKIERPIGETWTVEELFCHKNDSHDNMKKNKSRKLMKKKLILKRILEQKKLEKKLKNFNNGNKYFKRLFAFLILFLILLLLLLL
ncbi:MAG: hypothetical protein PHN31_01730 [Candidatus Gracilibacteria bacterium]|nr:hypothetical protein [Candidatus Gracilibacteria bacterium]